MTADQISLKEALRIIEAEKELRQIRIDNSKRRRRYLQLLKKRRKYLNKDRKRKW